MKMPIDLPSDGQADVDVVALGECSLDWICVVPAWPRPDEKLMLAGLVKSPGGQAATAALAVQRLGWRARFVGWVGDDDVAGPALERLRSAGVDVRVVVKAASGTRQAVLLVDQMTGARTVLEHRVEQLAEDEVPDGLVSSGRILIVDATSIGASIHAARAARARGVPVMVDVDGREAQTDDLLGLVDVLVSSEAAMASLAGTAEIGSGMRRLAVDYPVRVVITTLGPRGAVALCAGRETSVQAPSVEVVDTTGAGDAFRAGFAAGWLRAGSEARLEPLLRCACAVAALNCRALGAQAGLPTWPEVQALL